MSAATGQPVLEAAAQRARDEGEDALQVCAFQHGALLAEGSWGGDPEGREDRLFPIFSVTKAVTAVAVHLQAERGLLAYDDPVARHWPEFARHGKDDILIAHVLAHRAGIPTAPQGLVPERLADWEWIVAGIEDLEPEFPAGTVNAYHSLNFGWILGEVVRRTDGRRRSFGEFVRQELCEPLDATELYLGVPDDALDRVAPLHDDGGLPPTIEGSAESRALPAPVALRPEIFNHREVLQACIPAVGGVSDARSVARLFAMLANGGELDGVRLLSPERIRACLTPRPDGETDDLVFGRVLPVGVGGLWVRAPGVVEPGREVLAHPGAGGSVGWADLGSGVGAAICHNRMFGGRAEHPFAGLGRALAELASSET